MELGVDVEDVEAGALPSPSADRVLTPDWGALGAKARPALDTNFGEALPPVPSEDHYMTEPAYRRVRDAQDFEDLNLSAAAAGFVSYMPISMLMRRWPFRIFVWVCALYFTAYACWYAIFRDVGVDEPVELRPFAVLCFAVPALMCWGVPILAMMGYARKGVVVFAVAVLWNGVISFMIWTVGAVASRDYKLAVYTTIIVLIEISMAWVFFYREHKVWRVSIVDSFLACMCSGVLVLVFSYFPAVLLLIPALLWVMMVVFFLSWRKWSLRSAEIATKPDKLRYDSVWDEVKETKAAQLRQLAETVHNHMHVRVMQPFMTLDLIFQRGYSLNDWYQQVIAMWATACGAKAHRAPVKSLQRTLEKVHRSYKGRIPPVVDIVRSTIIVEEIDDAQTVLDYILARAVVHQIKNRFDLDYDGELTAGYRDLNLHLSFKELDGTPFQGFVFELQIHYAPILALKNDDGHRRYIRLRNLRGD